MVLLSYRDGAAMTDHDAYQRAGFGPHARDGQRCSDLRRKKLIEPTGGRGITPSGRTGRLCRITTRGKVYLITGALPGDDDPLL